MLGSMLTCYFSSKNTYTVHCTFRNSPAFKPYILNLSQHHLDCFDFLAVKELISSIGPHYVINCIGVIKQKSSLVTNKDMILLNSYLPQFLQSIAPIYEYKLVHFSTDCVFSGIQGFYNENDLPDPPDLYGSTKLVGEVASSLCLTLRTSIIGFELDSSNSLINWFLSQKAFSTVEGYTNAIYSGFPTYYIAQFLDRYILPAFPINGLYHLSSEPISKFHLLLNVKQTFNFDINLLAVDQPCIDRSLDSSLIQSELSFRPPDWSDLVSMLYSSKDLVSLFKV